MCGYSNSPPARGIFHKYIKEAVHNLMPNPVWTIVCVPPLPPTSKWLSIELPASPQVTNTLHHAVIGLLFSSHGAPGHGRGMGGVSQSSAERIWIRSLRSRFRRITFPFSQSPNFPRDSGGGGGSRSQSNERRTCLVSDMTTCNFSPQGDPSPGGYFLRNVVHFI